MNALHKSAARSAEGVVIAREPRCYGVGHRRRMYSVTAVRSVGVQR